MDSLNWTAFPPSGWTMFKTFEKHEFGGHNWRLGWVVLFKVGGPLLCDVGWKLDVLKWSSFGLSLLGVGIYLTPVGGNKSPFVGLWEGPVWPWNLGHSRLRWNISGLLLNITASDWG
jgi:hypothetical protein